MLVRWKPSMLTLIRGMGLLELPPSSFKLLFRFILLSREYFRFPLTSLITMSSHLDSIFHCLGGPQTQFNPSSWLVVLLGRFGYSPSLLECNWCSATIAWTVGRAPLLISTLFIACGIPSFYCHSTGLSSTSLESMLGTKPNQSFFHWSLWTVPDVPTSSKIFLPN